MVFLIFVHYILLSTRFFSKVIGILFETSMHPCSFHHKYWYFCRTLLLVSAKPPVGSMLGQGGSAGEWS